MKSKKLNTKAITVSIKENETGEVYMKEKVGSIIFAAVTESDKTGHTFSTGVAGEFSLNSLMRSAEAVFDVVADALIKAYDVDAEDFMELMSAAMSNSVRRNFSREEQIEAMAKGVAKIMEKAKNNKKVH